MENLNQSLPESEGTLAPTVRDVLAIGYRPPADQGLAPSMRDVVAIGFRHRRLLFLSFAVVLLAIVVPAMVWPKYEAEIKILVKRERVDPVISADQQQPSVIHDAVTEEELNSEVELLKSDGLLRKVALACGLDKKAGSSLARDSEEMRIAKAVRGLKKQLEVNAIRKTDLIWVKYESHSPQLAAQVLSTLANLYLEKHVAVHRPPGQFEFFQQQADQYSKSLADAEAELAKFPQQNGAVAAQQQRDSALQQLSTFQATLAQTRSAIAETKNRIAKLQADIASTPERITTQMRSSDNPTLMQQLKATLLQLDLKRTELLDKYNPTYREVQAVDRQIAETKAALAREESKPLRDVTTDQDPAHMWMREELAKANADLKTLQARETATAGIVAQYEGQADKLNQQQLVQGDLLRSAKLAEDNYLLYRKKAEEARITAALDQRRIMNVSLAESPSAPLLPAHSPLFYLMIGGILAATVSAGLVFARDYFDTSFRTPDDVRLFLDTPVLAALPKPSHS